MSAKDYSVGAKCSMSKSVINRKISRTRATLGGLTSDRLDTTIKDGKRRRMW
jgi:hypothetical protein